MKRHLIILITLVFCSLFADYEWITYSEWGTFNNQAKHIVRLGNYVHIVYCDRTGGCCVVYVYSSDYGNTWATPETVFKGNMAWVPMFTAIGVDGQNRPWVAIAWIIDIIPTWEYGELYLFIREGINNWRRIPIISLLFNRPGVPSMVISNTSGSSAPMAYITIPFTSCIPNVPDTTKLFFFAADREGVRYSRIMEISSLTLTAAFAYTPADYFHIVWEKGGRVYYQTILSPITPYLIRQGRQPQWSAIQQISTQEPITEPASNPSVETQGEWVYVVWRGPNEEGNRDFGEIWRRKGRIRPESLPYWYLPQNLSKSPLRESNYPQMSTGAVCVYQESLPNNNEVREQKQK